MFSDPSAFGSGGVSRGLVLSLFPGVGLLDMAFEQEGFCVVRGPDLLWGGDVRSFHPPAGKFDGVIGGPPCQAFSQANVMGHAGRQPLAADLIPEFQRCVTEAAPTWFLMENVRQSPLPVVPGYVVKAVLFNNRDAGGVQNRVRRFSFGTEDGRPLRVQAVALQMAEYAPCVTANGAQWDSRSDRTARGLTDVRPRSRSDRSVRMLAHYIRWQGLPDNFLAGASFTVAGKVRAVGNGVPIPLGRAIARAVRCALGLPLYELPSHETSEPASPEPSCVEQDPEP